LGKSSPAGTFSPVVAAAYRTSSQRESRSARSQLASATAGSAWRKLSHGRATTVPLIGAESLPTVARRFMRASNASTIKACGTCTERQAAGYALDRQCWLPADRRQGRPTNSSRGRHATRSRDRRTDRSLRGALAGRWPVENRVGQECPCLLKHRLGRFHRRVDADRRDAGKGR
jgi:hypothetical protein